MLGLSRRHLLSIFKISIFPFFFFSCLFHFALPILVPSIGVFSFHAFSTFSRAELLVVSDMLPFFSFYFVVRFCCRFVVMVLISECDDAGRVVKPVSFEEKCRLWKSSMIHVKYPAGSSIGWCWRKGITSIHY